MWMICLHILCILSSYIALVSSKCNHQSMCLAFLNFVQGRWLCRMRQLRAMAHRWKYLTVICFITYALVLYVPLLRHDERNKRNKDNVNLDRHNDINFGIVSSGESMDKSQYITKSLSTYARNNPYHLFQPSNVEFYFVESVMTNYGISLKEKLTCNVDNNAPPKIILSWNAGHSQEHLGGCPDWNCQLVHDRKKLKEAGAVLLMHDDHEFKRHDQEQYVIYFSQESPANFGFSVPYPDFFNMSLGFRHDTIASSPYGYTVKLAPTSKMKGQIFNLSKIEGKSKGAAWFVSHCGTNSHREKLVAQLQIHFPVDIYGACGQMKCAKGGECESMLDSDYHFYIAFENSICQDYITEKLWNQGYKREIVPLILKRSLVEPFVPPNSFIAVDDFKSTWELANYLHYLIKNKTAYAEYFNWRRDYMVIFLDGNNHNVMERPWGFCQICRLLWEQPKKRYVIKNFNEWWLKSCEKDGELVDLIVGREKGKEDEKHRIKEMNEEVPLRRRIHKFNQRNRILTTFNSRIFP